MHRSGYVIRQGASESTEFDVSVTGERMEGGGAPPISCRFGAGPTYRSSMGLFVVARDEGFKRGRKLGSSNPESGIVIDIDDGYGSARQECGMGLEGGSLRDDKVSTPRASGYSQEWLPDTLHIESHEGVFKFV